MGPKKKENTGKVFEDRVSSLFWKTAEAQEEEEPREEKKEIKEENKAD